MRYSLKQPNSSSAPNLHAPADATRNHAERRSHDRQLTIFRAVKLVSGTFESLCVARNLSSGGVMIDVSTSYVIGQNVCVSFAEDQNFEGQVIWQHAVTIGIQFDSEIDIKRVLEKPHNLPNGYRWRMPRIQVWQQARLRIGNRLLDIELHDISQCGARIKTDHEFCEGELLKIIVTGLEPMHAMVRWHQNGFAGLEFSNTIPLSALMQWRSVLGSAADDDT